MDSSNIKEEQEAISLATIKFQEEVFQIKEEDIPPEQEAEPKPKALAPVAKPKDEGEEEPPVGASQAAPQVTAITTAPPATPQAQ